jgi:transcriptional regulator with XRE-family HTH domain
MNHTPTLDSPLSIEGQTSAVFPIPIPLVRVLPLHRLGEARRQEEISRRNVACHLGITVQDVRRQECSTADLPLSVLHKWAKVLGLPVAELVDEPNDSLSTPLFNRAHLIRVMKTAMAILEQTGDPSTKRLAQTLVDQLIEIMPELRGVNALPIAGKRRRLNELGSAAARGLSDEVFMDAAD